MLPVLVGNARMPSPEQLPEDIRALTTINALLLRHESFDADTDKILSAALGVNKVASDHQGSLWSRAGYALAGIIAVAVLLLIAAITHFWILGRPLAGSVGEAGVELILIAGLVTGALIGLGYEAQKRRFK